MHQSVCFLRPALWMREVDPGGCDREGSSLGNAVLLTTCPSRGDGPQVQPSRSTPDGCVCGPQGLHCTQFSGETNAKHRFATVCKQRDLGSNPLRLSFLFKKVVVCEHLFCDFVPHN